MKCYLCDKNLFNQEAIGFVCICNNCLRILEASEARLIKKITEQQELINEFNRDANERYDYGNK